MQFYVHVKTRRADGTYDAEHTRAVDHKIDYDTRPLPFSRVLERTAYGPHLPTMYLVEWEGQWVRVHMFRAASGLRVYYLGDKYDPCFTVTWEGA